MKNPENKKINTYTKQFNPRMQSFTVRRNIVNCLVHVSLDVPNELHIMPWGPISLITLCSFPSCLSSPHSRQSVTEQDPVSTMQKTGWTNHSSFLVLSSLEKGFTLDVITRGQSTIIFLCIGPSRHGDNQTRTNK